MLVALLDETRIEASVAVKGPDYHCPQCQQRLVLKKGRIVIDHFAHKPPIICNYAKGETREHMSGKLALRDSFRERGLEAEVEQAVLSSGGDRRADVLVHAPTSKQRRIAIELQHQPIDLDQIERRTRAYVLAGIPVLWIPLLKVDVRADAEEGGGDDSEGNFYIEKYTTPPWQRWLVEYMGERSLWFYDPDGMKLWRAKLSPCELYVPQNDWYDSDGSEQSSGGYTRTSRRWMRLDLWGPFALADVRLTSWHRWPSKTREYDCPGGRVGAFVPAHEAGAVILENAEASPGAINNSAEVPAESSEVVTSLQRD